MRRAPPGLRRRAARRHALRVLRAVQPLRREGWTLAQCCEHLNHHMPTFAGREWTVGRLSQVLAAGRLAVTQREPRVRPLVHRGHDADDRAEIDRLIEQEGA